ncbi:hypothetical protein [Flavobacterium longum]
MNRFIKLNPEQKFIAALAGIALSLPALLFGGYALVSLAKAIL